MGDVVAFLSGAILRIVEILIGWQNFDSWLQDWKMRKSKKWGGRAMHSVITEYIKILISDAEKVMWNKKNIECDTY